MLLLTLLASDRFLVVLRVLKVDQLISLWLLFDSHAMCLVLFLVLFVGRLELIHYVFEVGLDDFDLVLLEQFFDDLVELVRLLLRQLLVETEQASLKVKQVVQVEVQRRL